MTKSEMKAMMVNGTQNRCWCPLCGQDGKRAAILAPWISPVGVLVCCYGACAECADVVSGAPPALRSTLMDKVETNLLAKYTSLWKKLPANYALRPNPKAEK